jgi:hypothetical protein
MLNRVSFDGEKIVLPDGMTYQILMLPPEESIDLDVLKKVEELVKAGLTVIAPRPLKATGLTNYPESDQELEEIAQKMWGEINGTTTTENSYGKGRVVWGKDVNQVLAQMNVNHDFTFYSPDPETKLDYIHRNTNEADIYFVVNRFAQKGINNFEYRDQIDLPDRFEHVECKFRVTGKVPELWDPMTGEIRKIYTWREEDGCTIIPLHFKPEGSQFIIFRDSDKNEPHISKIKKDGRCFFPGNVFEANSNPYIGIFNKAGQLYAQITQAGEYELTWSDEKKSLIKVENETGRYPIPGSWELSFDPEWGGPEKVVIDELKSWTEFTEEGIKYYSGTAVYQKKFEFSKADLMKNRAILDLGNLHELAEVHLNGKRIGNVWCSPFTLDVTDALIEGANLLKIEVVNLWPNRLILDGRLPLDNRLTKTNVTKFEAEDAEKYLRQSGLLGPVELKIIYVDELILL